MKEEVDKVKGVSANRHEARDRIKEDQERQKTKVHEEYV